MKIIEKQVFKKSMLALAVCTSLSVVSLSSAYAQQGGAIRGQVETQQDGASLAGITVTAVSDVMPKARTAVTKADGSYRLPLLLPGVYKLTFTAPNGSVKETMVEVLLDQTSKLSHVLTSASDNIEVISVTGSLLVLPEGDSSLTSSIGEQVVDSVPVGQDYRDLMKLIPGVQLSENTVMGPSAGGSGRDNKYGFDGVDVSLPMFGNLASEPSTHDIQSVSMDRGGAKAKGFNRSGGFAMNTISKSGTNEFHGSLEYKFQPKSLVADIDNESKTKFEEDKTWIVGSFSGPLIEDMLYFYGSFYRPEVKRDNKENAYGDVKNYRSVRDEYFGKFTFAPTDDLLLNVSYRTSEKEGEGEGIGQFATDSTSTGSTVTQDIFTIDGSYIINDTTTFDFKYSKFDNDNIARPDTVYANVNPVLGNKLDIDNLASLGYFAVPNATSSDPSYDAAVAAQLIGQYGYTENGAKVGGGRVGAGSTFNNQNFTREGFEATLEHELELGEAIHYLHFGFKWAEGTEELSRLSNGWGSISYVGGLNIEDFDSTTPVYYTAVTQQMSLENGASGVVPPIVSKSETFNIEINDTIEWDAFTFNIGALISKDVLYGQGLKANSNNVSGYELAPGHQYKMYTIDWKDMIQPRLGATWNYDNDDTVFVNYASYNPEASSLARAASWARNTQKSIETYYDKDGNYLGNKPASGSSGKFFQENMKPRRIDEFTIGTTKVVTEELFIRAHARYREGSHMWEDTWNGSRGYGKYQSPFGGVPDHIADKGDYIPDLADYRAEVGGSSYVIAELDGAYTKYYELALDATYTTDRWYLNASYVWSNYFGNFDQDNVSGTNDGNLFIGSSNLADGKGRQLWDGKNGKLLGNKPHVLKLYGYYTTDWEANIGAYFIYQSGDVWEKWDGQAYGYSSSTIRYAEHAGSRRSPSHWQMDLNYNQEFHLTDDLKVNVRADIFNVFDNQTGYSMNPYASSDTFGEARLRYSPRRVQLSAKISF